MSATIIYDSLKRFGAFKNMTEIDIDQYVSKFQLLKAGNSSKYNNMIVLYNNEKYHSLSEAYYCSILDKLKQENKIKDYRRQVSYKLKDMTGQYKLRYISDFLIYTNNNQEIDVDIKGRLTPENKIKLAYWSTIYNRPIVIVSTTGPNKFTTDYLF